MGLIKSMAEYFSENKRSEDSNKTSSNGVDSKDLNVYCQCCGKDLTGKDGDVTNTGRIYCNESDTFPPCYLDAISKGLEDVKASFEKSVRPDEILSLIEKGDITYYSPLEESVSEGIDISVEDLFGEWSFILILKWQKEKSL